MSSEPTPEPRARGRVIPRGQNKAGHGRVTPARGATAEAKTDMPATMTRACARRATRDPRWPHIAAALADLRERHRHAVRIVDADCACGTLLIETVRYARALGFTAIEGQGVADAPALIGRARAAAARLHDPAIGLDFEVGGLAQALAREADFPADIVLCHDQDGGIARLLAAAGTLVIADPVATRVRRQAA